MFGRKRQPQNVRDGAQPLTVTTLEDGQQVVHLPLPQRALISPQLLGAPEDGLIETIITFRFANRHARYRVSDVSDNGWTLVAELVQEGDGAAQLPPLIDPDPATMLTVKRFGL